MPVVLVVGIVAILVGVFFVATGRGGELAYEHADHAPLDLGMISATDVALLRPPTALWGYNMQVTDEALDRIARAVRDRDIEIAFLRRKLADLGQPAIDQSQYRLELVETVSIERALVDTAAGIEAGTTADDETGLSSAEPQHTGSAEPQHTGSVEPQHTDSAAAEETDSGEADSGRPQQTNAAEPPDDASAAAEEQGW